MARDHKETSTGEPSEGERGASAIMWVLDFYDDFEGEELNEANNIILACIRTMLFNIGDYSCLGIDPEEARKFEAANYMGQIPPIVREHLKDLLSNYTPRGIRLPLKALE